MNVNIIITAGSATYSMTCCRETTHAHGKTTSIMRGRNDTTQLTLDLYYNSEKVYKMLVRQYYQSMRWRQYVGKQQSWRK